jgi:hypothetical protein
MSRAKQQPLPFDLINNKFDYFSETGIIITRKTGKVGSWAHPSGYHYVSVFEEGKSRNLLAHRVAYALYTGKDPYPLEIDHINRNRGDNRIVNLRLATFIEQAQNRKSCKPVEIVIDGVRYEFDSITTAAETLNIPHRKIYEEIHREHHFTARYL